MNTQTWSLYKIINNCFLTEYANNDEIDLLFLEETYGDILYEFCDENIREFPWNCVSFNSRMSEDFMERYWTNLNLLAVSSKQKLSVDFILLHLDQLNAKLIAVNKNIAMETKLELRSALLELIKSNVSTSTESCMFGGVWWSYIKYLDKELIEFYGEVGIRSVNNYSVG